jgi:Abnormal spindle-like microcephaly-assoc'd, ASPM-SPD-2-Hydin
VHRSLRLLRRLSREAQPAAFAITSTASNSSFSIPLAGTGVTAGTLAANPTSIAFGAVQVGSSQSHSQTLTNTGGSLLHISTATVTGAGFATSGLSVPTTLNAGQSLTFNVTFTPQSSGNASGSLALTADGSVSNLSVTLSGSGASPGQLAVTPTTVNFGSVVVGATQNQSGTLTASGAGVTISSVSSTNSEFTLSGLSLPITLNAGQSANFTLIFAPQASGAASATITFASNATNPPVATSVSGTGTAPPQHSVSLGWSASTSTVAGYNVYRGSQSGGPYVAVNSGLDASTSYTDTSVQAGQIYYYVVTAVDGSGNESVYSNQAQAVIPTP